MNRKTFLKITAGAALGGTATFAACRDEDETPSLPGLDAPVGERTLPAIGLQLYTIRQMMVLDMEGALDAVADAGYTEVEFAGYFGRSPEEVRNMVRSRGLVPVSSHIPIQALRNDVEAEIRTAATIGHSHLIVPFVIQEERTPEGYRRLAEDLNTYGTRCREEGITLGYHNHDFEFRDLGGERGFDILLAETDPEVVTFELDLYWIVHGGGDPVQTLSGNPGRFQLCHVKDRNRVGQMVDVGSGVMPWGQYFNHAKTGGIEHFFVEHDAPEDPRRTMRDSHAFLSGLTF